MPEPSRGRATLTRAALTRAALTRATLTRATLTRATLTRATLTRAALTRAVLASLAAAGTLIAAAGAAGAGGTGYGGGGTTPVVAPGFSGVLTASTVKPSFRGAVKAKQGSTTVHVKVEHGEITSPTQIVITKGDDATVTGELVSSLAKDKVVLSFGVLLRQGSTPVTTVQPVEIVVHDASIQADDVITGYRHGHFVRIGTVTHDGRVHLYITASGQFALLRSAPAPKSKHASKG